MIRWILAVLVLCQAAQAEDLLEPAWQTEVGGGRFEKDLAVSPDGGMVAIHHHDDGGEESFSILKLYDVGKSKEPQAMVDLIKAGLSDTDRVFYLPGNQGVLVEDFEGPDAKYAMSSWLLVDKQGKVQVKRKNMGRFCLTRDDKGNPQAVSFDHRVVAKDQSVVFEIRPLELATLKPGKVTRFKVDHEHFYGKDDSKKELLGWLDCGLKRVDLVEGRYDPVSNKTLNARLVLTDSLTGKTLAEREVSKRELSIIARFLHVYRPTSNVDLVLFRGPGLPGVRKKEDDPWSEHQALTLAPDLQLKPVELALPAKLPDYSSKRCAGLGPANLICLMRCSRRKSGTAHQKYDVLALDLSSGKTRLAGRLDAKDDGDVFFAAGSDKLLVTVRSSKHGWQARSAQLYTLK